VTILTRFLVLSAALAAALSAPRNASAATPSACSTVRSCITTGVPQTMTSCLAATPACTLETPDKFGVTAQQLADRAIAKAKCSTKTTRRKCNVCYAAAKLPLQYRFKFDLFHGLLGQAVSLIEIERKAVCPALPVSEQNN